MYFKVGNTKIIAGKFSLQDVSKIEINFEYIFANNNNYRRFVNVISDSQGNNITINIKLKSTDTSDCNKLSQLLLGVEKIITQNNIFLIDQILEEKSKVNLEEFVELQKGLTKYFL